MKKILFILLLIGLSFGCAFAQEETGGEIEAVEIEIVKEKQITMPKASRNFEKVPPRPADPLAPAMTYDFKSLNFAAPDYNPVVKPLRLKDETLSKIYGNYVSAGFGNYNSPFLRGSISSKRNANKAYGVDFFSHTFGKGPVDGKNSGSGYSKVNGYISGIGPKVTADVGLTYENLFNHFYGYGSENPPPREENIRQTFNIIGINGGITNTKVSEFNYSLRGEFSYLKDRFVASENEGGLHFNSKYDINKTNSFIFKSDYFLIIRDDRLIHSDPRHLLRINPKFQTMILDNRFRLVAGVNAVVENDTIGKNKPVHIYPDAWIFSQLSKSIEAYAGITGDFEKVDLHTIARENQWIDNSVNIFHTNKSFEFRAGIQGKVARKVSFHVGTSVINYKNLYFYVKDNGVHLADEVHNPYPFTIVYDDAVRLNFFGELGVAHSDKVNVNVRGDYYSYSMKHLEYAWGRPTYKVGFYSSYKMFDKVLLTVDLLSQGGVKGYAYGDAKVVDLKPALVLNAKLRYFISKPLSVYLEVNNALNNKYPIYYDYVARGIQISGGFSWSF